MQQKGCCVTFSFCLVFLKHCPSDVPCTPWYTDATLGGVPSHGEAMACRYSGFGSQMSGYLHAGTSHVSKEASRWFQPSHFSHPDIRPSCEAPDTEEQRQDIPSVPCPNSWYSESVRVTKLGFVCFIAAGKRNSHELVQRIKSHSTSPIC